MTDAPEAYGHRPPCGACGGSLMDENAYFLKFDNTCRGCGFHAHHKCSSYISVQTLKYDQYGFRGIYRGEKTCLRCREGHVL